MRVITYPRANQLCAVQKLSSWIDLNHPDKNQFLNVKKRNIGKIAIKYEE